MSLQHLVIVNASLFQMVRAEKVTGFIVKADWLWSGSFTLLSDNAVALFGILAGQSSQEVYVYDMQGELHSRLKLPCGCDYSSHGLLEVTLSSHRHLAISCRWTRKIWLYSFTTQSIRSVYSDPSRRGPKPGRMCHGPNNTILVCDATERSSSVAVFTFTSENTLTLSRLIPVQGGSRYVIAVCYAETTQGPLLFTSHEEEDAICATHLQSGHKWQVKGQVDGKPCDPYGLCHGAGRLYVADGDNKRILVLDAATGDFIQSIELPQTVWVHNVAWSEQQPHLVVLQRMNRAEEEDDDSDDILYQISYFNIHPIDNSVMHYM